MFKRTLVPLDGSELAETALAYAKELATCGGAELELLRVVHAFVPSYYFEAPIDADELMQRDRAEAKTYVDAVAAKLRNEGLSVSTYIGQGPVADVIVDYADTSRADMIVMSTHGRSGIQRWLLGSVADRVSRGATVPVLLVRASAPSGAHADNVSTSG